MKWWEVKFQTSIKSSTTLLRDNVCALLFLFSVESTMRSLVGWLGSGVSVAKCTSLRIVEATERTETVVILLLWSLENCDSLHEQKRMVRERRGGYFDTKEHMAEGLPDVGDKKSVRVEENLLRHGKIGWDKLTLNKFCLLPEMGKNEIPSKIVWKKSKKELNFDKINNSKKKANIPGHRCEYYR